MAVRLIADTAAGLHAAHELRGWDGQLKEIVHCDVSPHNILIGLDGGVKLVDFGVAGAMNQISTDEEVKIRGKFGYMSPEQAQAKALDRRSDVFSLGIVLFELTTGYRLFRGRDDRHTLELVTWGKIPRPSQVISRYPEKLEAIVMRALERDIEKRYQTADEFRDALEAYLVEERILVPAAGVKGLLRRVLGTRIDQRRQQIRAALKALEGAAYVATTLVSEDPISGEEEAVSVSVSGSDPPSNPSFSESTSQSLGAAFLPGDGSSGVQTLSQPSEAPARSSRLVLMGAALGIVLAGAAVLVIGMRPLREETREPGHPAKAPSSAPKAVETQVPPHEARRVAGTEGLSIDSLPADPAATAPQALRPPPSGPSGPGEAKAKVPSSERLAKDMEALRAEAKAASPAKHHRQRGEPRRSRAPCPAGSRSDTHGGHFQRFRQGGRSVRSGAGSEHGQHVPTPRRRNGRRPSARHPRRQRKPTERHRPGQALRNGRRRLRRGTVSLRESAPLHRRPHHPQQGLRHSGLTASLVYSCKERAMEAAGEARPRQHGQSLEEQISISQRDRDPRDYRRGRCGDAPQLALRRSALPRRTTRRNSARARSKRRTKQRGRRLRRPRVQMPG